MQRLLRSDTEWRQMQRDVVELYRRERRNSTGQDLPSPVVRCQVQIPGYPCVVVINNAVEVDAGLTLMGAVFTADDAEQLLTVTAANAQVMAVRAWVAACCEILVGIGAVKAAALSARAKALGEGEAPEEFLRGLFAAGATGLES